MAFQLPNNFKKQAEEGVTLQCRRMGNGEKEKGKDDQTNLLLPT